MEEPEHFRTGVFEAVKNTALTPSFLLVVLLLEKRENINQAIEFYNVGRLKNYDVHTYNIQSRLFSLFLDIKASYEDIFKKEEVKKQKIKEIETLLGSGVYENLIKAYDVLNRFLYDKGVTKFDLNKIFDDSNIIFSNARKGYS